MTRRNPVRVLRIGESPESLLESTRWLNKWGLDWAFGREEGVMVWDTYEYWWTYVAPGKWMILYPRTGEIYVRSNVDFMALGV